MNPIRHSEGPSCLAARASAAALVALALCAAPAQAALIDLDSASYHDSVFVQGGGLNQLDLSSSQAGTLTLTIKDIDWTALLQSLSASLSVQGKSVLTEKGPGSITLDISKGEVLSLGIYAVAGGSLKYGLYTLDCNFTPRLTTVPVPAAGLLLASGLGLLPALRRRRKATAKA